MRAAVLALVVVPTIAAADPAPIVGGTNAPQGKWPDAAAILYRFNGKDGFECSGVLVGPSVVLTAGHCANPAIGVLDNVLLGTNSLARPDDGETLGVIAVHEYPSSQTSIDIAALELSRNADENARPLATGWARLDIVNGAAVEIVGYGAIDSTGSTYVDDLQEATTAITDFDCSGSTECYPGAQPEGELGAGGDGVDSCNGDSGGPLYLLARYGTYVAGITSRGYTVDCGTGGIYARPDKIADWIEQVTNRHVARGPEPKFGTIHAAPGAAGETTLSANDPVSHAHDYTITTPPAQGMAAIRASDGRVRVCVDPAAAAGADSLVVTITDQNNPARALAVTIPIAIADAAPPAKPCDVEAFSVDSGGCCDSGGDARGAGSAIALALTVIFFSRWPRRGSSAAPAGTRSRSA
jgi:secreted trypsin-like serine protease